MSLLITNGLGKTGDGTRSGLLTSNGMGSSGDPADCPTHAFALYELENLGTTLRLAFSGNLVLSGPAVFPSAWKITAVANGKPVTITKVQYSGPILTLTVSEQTKDAIYTLHIPQEGITDVDNRWLMNVFETNFVGIGQGPALPIARSMEARILEVVFSEAVVLADALNPANYTITNGLQVLSVEMINEFTFLLHTTKQTSGTVYTIAAANVRDLHGNLIDTDT